MRGTGLLKVIK